MAKRIVHKHTLVKCKQVRADQIEFGEIAINAHESGPYLQVKDRSGEVVRVGGVIFSDHQPPCAQKGAWWMKVNTRRDPVDHVLYLYDGRVWIPISGGPITNADDIHWDDILGKPDCFYPCPHTHKWNQVEDKPCLYECHSYIQTLQPLA